MPLSSITLFHNVTLKMVNDIIYATRWGRMIISPWRPILLNWPSHSVLLCTTNERAKSTQNIPQWRWHLFHNKHERAQNIQQKTRHAFSQQKTDIHIKPIPFTNNKDTHTAFFFSNRPTKKKAHGILFSTQEDIRRILNTHAWPSDTESDDLFFATNEHRHMRVVHDVLTDAAQDGAADLSQPAGACDDEVRLQWSTH